MLSKLATFPLELEFIRGFRCEPYFVRSLLIRFICEAKSVSKKDVLIVITWPIKVMQ